MKSSGARSGQLTILCVCKARVTLPFKAIGQPQICPSCEGRFKVVAQTGQSPRLVFLKKPATAVTGHRCTCGTPLFVNDSHAGKNVTCPTCRKSLHFEKVRDPQTLTTKIRLIEAKDEKKVRLASATGPALKLQPLTCACGKKLLYSAKHVGKYAKCPGCGMLMRLERVQDPQTMRTTVVRPRILGNIGKVERAPKPDLDSWSLDDFK